MRLRLAVVHESGVVSLDSFDPFDLEAAAQAFHGFAFAADESTEIKVPGRTGPVRLKAGDIDSFDLTWEA